MSGQNWPLAPVKLSSSLTIAWNMHVVCLLTLAGLLLLSTLWPARVMAHSGGTPVLVDEPAGPYRVFAWLQPDPPRVGKVHLDIAVTLAPPPDAPPNPLVEPVTDANVQVTWTPQSQPGAAIVVKASPQSGLNGFYYEINTTLGVADLWHVELLVQGADGEGKASFEHQVLSARSVNWYIVAGAGVGLLALIGLMGLWNRRQASESEVKRLSPGGHVESES